MKDNHIFPFLWMRGEDEEIIRTELAKIDEAADVQEMICYDRARAVCKWASTCGATIKSQRVQDGQLHLSFSFSSAEQLKEFEESASINIGGATMTAEHFEQASGRRR